MGIFRSIPFEKNLFLNLFNNSIKHEHSCLDPLQQCDLSFQQRLRPACTYAQTDQNLCWLFEYSLNIKLLTEQHFDFLSCSCSSASTLVKMPQCWKSHVKAHIFTVSVRAGRCNSAPAKCMGPNADVTKICEHDKEITCLGSYIYCFSKGRKM